MHIFGKILEPTIMKNQINFIIQKQDKKHYIMINWGYGYKEIVDGKTKYLPLRLSTGITLLHKDKFDVRKQRMITGEPDHIRKNAELDKLETKILGYITNYKFTESELPSPTQIKFYLQSDGEVKSTSVIKTGFVEYIERYIKKMNFPYNTSKGYNQFLSKVKLYEEKHKVKFYIEQINKKLFESFISFVENLPTQTGKVRSINDVSRYKGTFKRMLREAEADDIQSNFTKYENIVVKQTTSDSVYLDEQQIKLVKEVDLNDVPDLIPVRDLFIIGLYTGLRISDLKRIKLNLIVKVKNQLYLIITQKKVKVKVKIPLTDLVMLLIKKYKGVPQMSEQHFNRNVKEVCRLAGLDHHIEITEYRVGGSKILLTPFYLEVSAHTCRRSFCSNLYRKGIPPQVIMVYSGHSTLNSFYKYIKVTPNDLLEDFLDKISEGLNSM